MRSRANVTAWRREFLNQTSKGVPAACAGTRWHATTAGQPSVADDTLPASTSHKRLLTLMIAATAVWVIAFVTIAATWALSG